ncbi:MULTISPECIES: purine-nucleoside phosphorylase [Helicobacter]|uniref:Purine nucleoside phosphorylase n=1 Tax=Helicobacter typhlonius TaxID=76936 RepID=A0A099UDB5_9HELI|nr:MULTISPECIES: purine-nucleoside phosphorylase [Helicobacter]TLD78936.1 purine-nucleoside phosphorylase [Helicobacter typhlonius]TLD90269.1 purine-nucleoside phosphorylase [Helicobacter sp. MIT 03-1616]CUU40959.1 Purine nucleoside phosphorylase [Helicobacter typhlonius]HCD72834.1 purine-nucleoside phosphorylase [Helicobacter sp.]
MIVCAGNGEYFSFAKSIGIGLCESAIGLTQVCLRESVDSIIFVGSAGAYSKDICIGDICLADNATQIELGFLEDKAYTPLDNHIQSGVLNEKYVSYETYKNLATYKKVIVNSSNYITTDEAMALRFANANIALENMEFFAVMRVAQYFHLPCAGVFCVSNHCHKNAHNEFLSNHQMVKEKIMAESHFIQQLSYALAHRNESNDRE